MSAADPVRRNRLCGWVVAAMVSVGVIALVRGGCPSARAAEVEPPSPRTHQLTVCQPGQDCERRGRPMGATACSLDMASERMLAGLPSGTWIACVRVAK